MYYAAAFDACVSSCMSCYDKYSFAKRVNCTTTYLSTAAWPSSSADRHMTG